MQLPLSDCCRHLSEAKDCLYGDKEGVNHLCEAYDSLRHGQELALDFICNGGHSGTCRRSAVI